MTREEVIAVLQKIKPTPRRADGKSTTHALETIALDMAIKALEQQPTFEELYEYIRGLEYRISDLEDEVKTLSAESRYM